MTTSTPSHELEIFRAKALYVLKIVLASSALVALTILGKNVLLLGFAAILLAVFFHALARLVEHFTHWQKGLSLVVGIGSVILFFALAVMLSAPSIKAQTQELSQQLPGSLTAVKDFLRQYPTGSKVVDRVSEGVSWQDISFGGGGGILTKASGVASSLANAFVNFFVILLAGIYLTLNPRAYRRNFVELFPLAKRERVENILRTLGDTLTWWLAGRLFSMGVIGIGTMLGLFALGVPLAFLLGLLAALISFVPNIGPILSAIPAVLLGFSESPQTALYVIVLYVVVQIIESYFLTPLVERKTVSIRPGFLLITQLFFGIFFGILGLTLASPIVASGIVLTRKLYIEPMEEKGA